jgi:hypothetical protein
MTTFARLLGRLPREEGKSAVAVIPSAGAAPTRPAEVHNIELDAADTNMYGNGGTEVLGTAWGDCVFVMIEKDRVLSALALGVQITKLTPAQVVRNYCDYNGIPYAASSAPGPGSYILGALKWAQNHPERFGGSKLLFYGDYPITDEGMKQAVAEFGSVCVGVVVYQSMEYPNKVWYNAPRGANVGGHGIAGGSYTAAANFIKTWGYMVSVNANGFGTIDELVICVWDFQWRALTYERQLACIASYQFVTGKPWTGPAPINPLPYAPRIAMSTVFDKPARALDTRIGNGLSGKFRGGATRTLQIGGRTLTRPDGTTLVIPANAVGIAGNLAVTTTAGGGYAARISPVPGDTGTSVLNFVNGQTTPNAFTIGLAPDGSVAITLLGPAAASADFVLDVTAIFLP